MRVAHDLLTGTGVAVAPGIDFDTVAGGRSIRFSFAGSGADLTQALDRMAGFLS